MSGPIEMPAGEDRVLLALPVDAAETLARILIQFDTHVDTARIDFEYDHTRWHHLAIDLLKARAVVGAARTGTEMATARRLDVIDLAAKSVVQEAERHLKAVSEQ